MRLKYMILSIFCVCWLLGCCVMSFKECWTPVRSDAEIVSLKYTKKTRMYSSRMCTDCSSSHLRGGLTPPPPVPDTHPSSDQTPIHPRPGTPRRKELRKETTPPHPQEGAQEGDRTTHACENITVSASVRYAVGNKKLQPCK